MKTRRSLYVTMILLLIAHVTNAQFIYPVAVSSNGVVCGNYNKSNDAINSLPKEISTDEAKNIFAINAILIDKTKMPSRVKVIEYQMTIYEKGDTTIIKNNSELLSTEMKIRLSKITPGSIIYFEGIKAGFSNEESRSVLLLSFTVI